VTRDVFRVEAHGVRPARRLPEHRAGAPLAPAPTALLALQRLAGNQAVQRLLAEGSAEHHQSGVPAFVERSATSSYVLPRWADQLAVQALAYNRTDNRAIWTTLDAAATKIKMDGKLRGQQADEVINVVATLDFKEKLVPLKNVTTGFASWFASDGTARALDISTMDAKPGGHRIGQILTYHLGLIARQRGIGFVTAGNVSDARGPFYTPLGFRDFVGSRPWLELVRRKTDIEAAAHIAPTAELLQEKASIIELMMDNKIYIPVDALIDNSAAKWREQWVPA
jgi:hypothetical protein